MSLRLREDVQVTAQDEAAMWECWKGDLLQTRQIGQDLAGWCRAHQQTAQHAISQQGRPESDSWQVARILYEMRCGRLGRAIIVDDDDDDVFRSAAAITVQSLPSGADAASLPAGRTTRQKAAVGKTPRTKPVLDDAGRQSRTRTTSGRGTRTGLWAESVVLPPSVSPLRSPPLPAAAQAVKRTTRRPTKRKVTGGSSRRSPYPEPSAPADVAPAPVSAQPLSNRVGPTRTAGQTKKQRQSPYPTTDDRADAASGSRSARTARPASSRRTRAAPSWATRSSTRVKKTQTPLLPSPAAVVAAAAAAVDTAAADIVPTAASKAGPTRAARSRRTKKQSPYPQPSAGTDLRPTPAAVPPKKEQKSRLIVKLKVNLQSWTAGKAQSPTTAVEAGVAVAAAAAVVTPAAGPPPAAVASADASRPDDGPPARRQGTRTRKPSAKLRAAQ
ncbi:MAG: hypothetical protein M1825_006423 [Sarcosagium campestre]|nr:MAG: hypothetical protein M1825_006423 [Sarcosagium campestre]